MYSLPFLNVQTKPVNYDKHFVSNLFTAPLILATWNATVSTSRYARMETACER